MENPINFEVRGKSFFLTYPRCDVDLTVLKDHLVTQFNGLNGGRNNIHEYIVASETHKDEGLHRHCYVNLLTSVRTKVSQSYFNIGDHHPNFQNVRNEQRVVKYCAKDGDYISNCKAKIDKWNRTALKKTKEDIAKELMGGMKITEAVVKYPQLLFGYSRLKMDVQAYMLDKQDKVNLPTTCGVWIAGPAGAGKDTIATERMGAVYLKGRNKWWDGYGGQPTIVCQDVDATWDGEFKYYLKIWADRYPFNAETKNGTMQIRPTKFVITSNLTLEEWLGLMGLKTEYEQKPYTRRFRSYWITCEDDWDNQL